MIEHNRPWITPEDRSAVDAVLASNWVAQGPMVKHLEDAFVALRQGGAACAVSSGTAALGLALRSMKLGPGSAVAVPTYSCSALLNAVTWVGADVQVVDVLPSNFGIDPAGLDETIDAVVVVHVFGSPADTEKCREIVPFVVEDCCQSLGGEVNNRPLGTIGLASVYSFYATKIVCGGQGGMVCSCNEAVVDAVRDFRQFDGRATYEPRFNFQMTDIQAALVLSQMNRLAEIKRRRQLIAQRYRSILPSDFSCQGGLVNEESMPQRFVLIAPDQGIRDALQAFMEQQGVRCIVPVQRFELLHRYLGMDPARFPVAERLSETTLSLPLYPSLGEEELDHICEAFRVFCA